MSGIHVENEDLRALVLLASSSDSFGNLREEIEQETRDDATTEILHRIQSNAVCVVELLQKMDAILTSENTTVRARATEVLAKCVRSVSVKTTEQQKEEQQQRVRESLLLTQFFASKLRELCTLTHGLDGMSHSLRCLKRAMTFDDEEEERVVNSRVNDEGGSSSRRRRYKDAAMINQCIDGSIKELFEHVHAPSLAHRDRQKVYAVLEELLREFPRATVLGGDFDDDDDGGSKNKNNISANERDEKKKKAVGRLESIVANCDGERDPRNVLALCRLWRELPKAFNEAEEDVVDAEDSTTTTTSAQAFVANCEEVYDVVAAYFPISFKPPQNDSVKITREELASGLRIAMTATNCYAPFAIPHVLESVVSGGENEGAATAVSGEACADAIDCLETMGSSWPDEDIATDEICKNVWSRLRLCVISPRDLEWSKPVRRATARLFANENSTFSRKILKLALDDQSINACEQAFKAYKAHKKERSKDVPTAMECGGDSDTEQNAMEVDGEKENEGNGCCGGGCNKTQHQEHSRSDEIETTARVAAAVAGRCLGAAAAANVAAAKVAASEKLKKLLGAIRDDEEDAKNNSMPHWRSIAMVLITPTIGGALDASLLSSSSSSSSKSSVEEILGSELRDILRDTLVSGLRSFTCKTKDHDGVVLSIACASAFLQFPEFSKVEDANAKKAYADVLEALFWVATTASNEEIVFSNKEEKNNDDSSSPTLADEADDRRLRVNDALVVAINSDESNGILAAKRYRL